jgi:hypothetical protein
MSLGFAQTLEVEVGSSRSIGEAMSQSDQAVKKLNRNLAILSRNHRDRMIRAGRSHAGIPALYPATVWLKSNGQRLPSPTRSKGRFFSAPLNLVFDASGPNSFPTAYRDFLQDIYDAAQPLLDGLFGLPSIGGDVAVKNYNVPMGDREYVTGGYYVPNSPGTPEIRFPIYSDGLPEVTVINFVHTLLLAYIGPNQYGFDAFNEGLVRAVTLRMARTPSFTNQFALDGDQIEAVLSQTYDVGGLYDWLNQRALGGSKFIAPNLRDVPLPDAGSVGGIYHLRYKMAGCAWMKLLVENQGFIAAYNNGFYAQPGIASNVPALIALGQTTLNSLSTPTIEGLTFAEWFKRQYILETKDTQGPKLLVEPLPITSELSGSDFGVFDIVANWFETLAGGNETLLSGTSFPILWEGNTSFNRIFPSTPDSERMDIAGAYGSVAPNIPNINGGNPYRAVVDVPVQDQIGRVYLPVGSIATASQQTPRDFFGTVTGANLQPGDTVRLEVTVNGSPITDVVVTNNAFGVLLNTPEFSGNARISIDVVRNRSGLDATLLTRKVNKGPGPLAVDLRVESEQSFTPIGGLPKGISLIGFAIDPFASLPGQILGLPENQVLAARYNSSKAKYDLYPELEPFKVGHGYFVRLNAAQPAFAYEGRNYRNVEGSVALKPGWNLVCSPLTENVPTSRIRVVKTSDFPQDWSEAALDVGTEFFEFIPGPNDPATGAPETGTMAPATQFESGKAYFVRVLAPEGVTLTFRPEALTGSAPNRAPSATTPSTGWRLSLTMRFGTKQKASVILGQSATATRSFDPREDSGMPPSFGNGFQLIVEDYEAMYRDIRALAGGEAFTIHLKGLTSGKTYPIDFKSLFGKAPNLNLRDRTGRSLGSIRPGMTYNHYARAREDYIQVVVGGTK